MANSKTLREIIIESSVVISSLLIFFGFLKQYWYYDYFNIKIQNYLSIDEVLLMFLGELPFLIKLIFGAIIYYVLILIAFKIFCFIKDSRNKNDIDAEQELSLELENLFTSKKKIMIMFILSIFLSVLGFVIFNYYHGEFAIIYLTLMFCQTIYLFFDIVDIGIDSFFNNLIVSIFSLTIMLYCKNIIDIENVNKKTNDIDLAYFDGKDERLVSTFVLIGKTKDFVFLLNKSDDNVKIIKSESFISIGRSSKRQK